MCHFFFLTVQELQEFFCKNAGIYCVFILFLYKKHAFYWKGSKNDDDLVVLVPEPAPPQGGEGKSTSSMSMYTPPSMMAVVAGWEDDQRGRTSSFLL